MESFRLVLLPIFLTDKQRLVLLPTIEPTGVKHTIAATAPTGPGSLDYIAMRRKSHLSGGMT